MMAAVLIIAVVIPVLSLATAGREVQTGLVAIVACQAVVVAAVVAEHPVVDHPVVQEGVETNT